MVVTNPLLLLAGAVSIAVAAVGAALCVRYGRLRRRGLPSRSFRKTDWVLIATAIVSVVLYFDFAFYPNPGFYLNAHDVFHYYMGSKYAKELGYQDLYACAAVADWESNAKRSSLKNVRSMQNYKLVPVKRVFREADAYRARFSAERWLEFKRDSARFKELLATPQAWRRLLIDKGYNATPVWTMTARQISSRVPTTIPGIAVLVSLDVLILALTFVLVGRAFGWRTALLALCFLGVVFVMAFGHTKGAFLRMDWVCLLVMACCMIKTGHYKTAGAMAAYACMVRIFPVLFVFPLGAKAFGTTLRTRQIDRRHLAFFLTFAGTVFLLFVLSILDAGGIEAWRVFWTKIRLHDDFFSRGRVGFRYLFMFAYENPGVPPAQFGAAKTALFHQYQTLWWTVQAIVLFVAVCAAQRLEDYETIPLGYALVFFLTAPTYYYHVMQLAALFLFIPKLERPARTTGAVLFFAITIVSYILSAFWPEGLTLSFAQSSMLLAASLYMLWTGLQRAASARAISAPN